MDKTTEIQHLQALKEDTYFAQFFSASDIDQMCQNIKNDLPIEFGTGFVSKADKLNEKIKDLRVQHRDAGRILVSQLVTAETQESVLEILTKTFGTMQVIKAKRENGVQLSEKDIDYLYNLATQNE